MPGAIGLPKNSLGVLVVRNCQGVA